MNPILKINNSYFITNTSLNQNATSSSKGKDSKINLSKKDEQTIQAILAENNQILRKVPQVKIFRKYLMKSNSSQIKKKLFI
jgi:hypothetical protein